MAKQKCPECPPEGLPGYMGTMADMFTLLFAFFVLMFSLATMDPAKLDALGGDKAGAADAKEAKEAVEEIKKEMQELKENGITEINGKPIEEYADSLIEQKMKETIPPPKLAEVRKDVAEIIEDMELDTTANLSMRDQRGIAFELNGDICFKALSAEMQPELMHFLDAAADSFLVNPNDKRQVIVEGHTDNWPIPKKFKDIFPTNWELSTARASAVVNYLIEKGVDASRLVAHGYAERWPADLTWTDMRKGYVEEQKGTKKIDPRTGQASYEGDIGRSDVKKQRISIPTMIDSLNSTMELRRKNRRIKIIFTYNNYVDGSDPWVPPKN
ncbi:MAG: flagellar motor protein MotB [Candidatus Marinimicrobia bacterium]|nr:flagellar motor protein MotB [Candidatus Neomarinimicrobiota bacterium]MDP6852660.1 flagellar motor protein MotB [Candidatus Neomarinimicrobiota bacterium]MDP6935938.1 flagellar motor protein MotB [Candidatus Neomarinimicrobiota bacterium]